MKHVNDIEVIIPSEDEIPGSDKVPNFSGDQIELVNAFFRMLERIYGPARFKARMGSDDELIEVKRLWAPDIVRHSREELSQLFQAAKQKLIAGDDRFQWPDPGAVLGLGIGDSWEHRRQSRPAHEAMNAPIIDKGERRYLPPPADAPKTSDEFFAAMRKSGMLKVRR